MHNILILKQNKVTLIKLINETHSVSSINFLIFTFFCLNISMLAVRRPDNTLGRTGFRSFNDYYSPIILLNAIKTCLSYIID